MQKVGERKTNEGKHFPKLINRDAPHTDSASMQPYIAEVKIKAMLTVFSSEIY